MSNRSLEKQSRLKLDVREERLACLDLYMYRTCILDTVEPGHERVIRLLCNIVRWSENQLAKTTSRSGERILHHRA